MTTLSCFCSPKRKKKQKGGISPITPAGKDKNAKTVYVKVEHLKRSSSETTDVKSSSFSSVPVPFPISESYGCNVKVIDHDSPVAPNACEVDYEGGDELDETSSMKRDNSDFDLRGHIENSSEEKCPAVEDTNIYLSIGADIDNMQDNVQNSDAEEGIEMIQSGHVSDPGIGKSQIWAAPKLKRSCSDLVMRSHAKQVQIVTHGLEQQFSVGEATSPVSVKSNHSADKVILKKHSSSQILPSRSKRLWWKLFLWSHRNMHQAAWSAKPQMDSIKPAVNQQGGYCSDTEEPNQAMELNKLEAPESLSEELVNKGKYGVYGVSGMWPQNQWVAFPLESSPLARIEEWVTDASIKHSLRVEDDDQTADDIVFPPSPENSSFPPGRSSRYPEEISHANSVIQSLNASSTVAHIAGIGLKVVPQIAHFCSLRSLNLSGNLIAHITPGSLPKGLHTLKLSRNKIASIEGLKELTYLRVLDLSYNRISRIGQGLSNCTIIKELYLSGNKISSVEGLHRLLKLTVLDLSFNKISTAKALGQLVANYNSLIALNLLGNPIQSNVSSDQLRKKLCSLLPKLAYLNKQPINPQKAREIGADSIAKAALGNSSRNTRRQAVKRVTQGSSSSANLRRSKTFALEKEKNRHRLRSRSQHHSIA